MSEEVPNAASPSQPADKPTEEAVEESFGTVVTEYPPGKIIDGKYEIVERIGSGGMAVVYKARHIHLSRVVAVKVLRSHLIDSQEFLRRFRKEAQVTSRLNHPNAVTVFDSGEAEGMPYLVMEFVSGRSLKRRILDEGPRNVAELEDLLSDVCPALAQAHALGIVHRDIKPDNVILSANDQGTISSRLVDFGVAKTLFQSSDDLHTTATVSGMFLGTPKYAAPEQVLGKNVDGRTDIYSLGILLYESLTGVVPFDAPTAVELIVKHAQEKPPQFKEKLPSLQPGTAIEAVVFRCLEKDPAKRFQSVSELLEAFQKAAKRDRYGKLMDKANLLPFVAAGAALLAIVFVTLPYFRGEDAAEVKPAVVLKTEKAPEVAKAPEKTTADAPVAPVAPVAPPVETNNAGPTTSVASPIDFGKFFASVGDAVSGTKQNNVDTAPPDQIPPVAEQTPGVAPTFTTPQNAGLLPLLNTVTTDQVQPVPTVQVAAGDNGAIVVQPVPTPLAGLLPEAEGPADDALKGTAEKNFNDGRKLYHQRKYDQAVPLLESAVRGKPRHIKARLDLANCYLRLGKRTEALSQIQAAIRIDANYPPANFDLACFYALDGNDDAALNALEKAVRFEPAAKDWARGEKDLQRLKSNPRFDEIID